MSALTGSRAVNWRSVRRVSFSHADRLALVVLLGVAFILPAGRSLGVAGLGLVGGAGIALQAMGMVLIYRANRVINFAQAQLGAVTGVVFYQLMHHSQFALWAVSACPSCFKGLPNDPTYLQANPAKFVALMQINGYGAWITANFWVSLVLSLLLAPLLAWLVHALVVRRFDRAPRLILTVVTIGIAQVLVAVAGLLPGLFQAGTRDEPFLLIPLHDVVITLSPVVFHLGSVLTVCTAVVAVVALLVFLRFSGIGVAMRATAENSARASLAGINAGRTASVSWVLAGTLSGAAAVLTVISEASNGIVANADAFDAATLVLVLAAVVFARMTSIWLAVVASLALGVIEQVLYFSVGSEAVFASLLVVVIGLALLLQASRQSRSERDQATVYQSAREARPIPRELRGVPIVDGSLRWGGLLILATAIGLPFVLAPAQVSFASVTVCFAMIGLSLLVITGWAGQVSLGQFAFAAIGGYVTALLAGNAFLSFLPVSLVVAGIAGALAATLVGVPALRLRGVYLGVTTLALALAVTSVLLNSQYLGQFLPPQLNRPIFLGLDLGDERTFYYVCLLFLVVIVFAVLGIRRSRTARALIACRDNEAAGQSLGISLLRVRLQAFAISGFIAGAAGCLLALATRAVEPSTFSAENSIAVFLMAVVGGMGSVSGPLLGAGFFGVLLIFGPLWAALGEGFGVVGLLLMFPGGLASIVFGARDAMLRRVAIRRRIFVPGLFGATTMRRRAEILPRRTADGGTAATPQRYRLTGQWKRFSTAGGARHD